MSYYVPVTDLVLPKNGSSFTDNTFENLTSLLTADIFNFEQIGPEFYLLSDPDLSWISVYRGTGKQIFLRMG